MATLGPSGLVRCTAGLDRRMPDSVYPTRYQKRCTRSAGVTGQLHTYSFTLTGRSGEPAPAAGTESTAANAPGAPPTSGARSNANVATPASRPVHSVAVMDSSSAESASRRTWVSVLLAASSEAAYASTRPKPRVELQRGSAPLVPAGAPGRGRRAVARSQPAIREIGRA